MESQSLSSSPATLVPSHSIGDNPILSHEFVTEDDSQMNQAFGPADREYSLDDSDLIMDVLERETRYGALPAVHRLPAEILSAIFEWLATMYISQCHSTLRFDWWIAFPEMNLEQSHSRPSKFRSPADYWSNINLVCRRWRRVTLSTPALWTYINLTEQVRMNSQSWSTILQNTYAEASFERSGALPLVLYCASSAFPLSVANIDRPRVQKLFLHDVTRSLIQSWATNAPSLEFLVVHEPASDAATFLDRREPWSLPSLKTLMTFKCPFWRYGEFSNLRQLIVSSDNLVFESNFPIFEVLAKTPYLEDLVLLDVTVIDGRVEEYATSTLPTINLKSLKRIKISESQAPVIAWLLDRKLVYPEGVARDYSFSDRSIGELETTVVNSWATAGFHPAKRLHISNRHILMSDGTSAVRLSIAGTTQRGLYLDAFMPLLESQTCELWFSIHEDTPPREIAFWVGILARLRCVKTLILYDDIPGILLAILSSPNKFFPSLVELETHHPKPEHYPQYLAFLQTRRRLGHPMETFRFVGTDAWQDANAHTSFAGSVDSVVTMNEASKFELPAVCTNDSPVHAYWTKWKT